MRKVQAAGGTRQYTVLPAADACCAPESQNSALICCLVIIKALITADVRVYSCLRAVRQAPVEPALQAVTMQCRTGSI